MTSPSLFSQALRTNFICAAAITIALAGIRFFTNPGPQFLGIESRLTSSEFDVLLFEIYLLFTLCFVRYRAAIRVAKWSAVLIGSTTLAFLLFFSDARMTFAWRAFAIYVWVSHAAFGLVWK